MLEHSTILLLTCIKRYVIFDNWVRKPIFGLFESGRFTQVLLYLLARIFFLVPTLCVQAAKAPVCLSLVLAFAQNYMISRIGLYMFIICYNSKDSCDYQKHMFQNKYSKTNVKRPLKIRQNKDLNGK